MKKKDHAEGGRGGDEADWQHFENVVLSHYIHSIEMDNVEHYYSTFSRIIYQADCQHFQNVVLSYILSTEMDSVELYYSTFSRII